MGPPVNVDAVALRASQYWMEDGLVEIMLGLIMAGPSCLFLQWAQFPEDLYWMLCLWAASKRFFSRSDFPSPGDSKN